MTPDPVIEAKGLSFRHPVTVSGRTVTALEDVNLSINSGEIIGIAGVSGSGKSTFCSCLNGLIPHVIPGVMTGTVTVLGEDTRSRRVTDLAAHVALVFQNPEDQLFSSDVESELAFGPEQLGWTEEEIERAIERALDALDIGELRKRDTGELSWGERQRVAIAAALAVCPEVLVLDEPFSGIDHAASSRLVRFIRELNRSLGTTVILTEQRLSWLIPVVKRMIVFEHGKVVYDGDPGRLPGWYTKEDANYARPTGKSLLPGPGSGEAGRTPGISLRDVVFRYPGREMPAIFIRALDIFPGEITVIQGPNGSGKSTLIKLFNGLLVPGSGELRIGDQDVQDRSIAERSRTVGVLLQHSDYQLFAETVYEELAFGPANHGVGEQEIAERIQEIASTLGIAELGLETPPLGLSAGEKQRVAIGSLLAMKPRVVVLDEPTLGLDRNCKRIVGEVLQRLKNSGISVIVATHDEEFSWLIRDRLITLEKGEVVSDSRAIPAELQPAGSEE
jgi:energy-coupling factor transporter ATP-binding protein EcfA2